MTLLDRKGEVIRTLARHRGQERMAALVAWSRRAPSLAPEHRTELNRVEGCLSRLWLHAEIRVGRCYFQADSDSAIVKGVAAIFCEVYSGATPGEILSDNPAFLADAGVTQHLTPNRRNGLSRLWAKMQAFACVCQQQAAA